MNRRRFLSLLAAGASLAVPTRVLSSTLDESVPLPDERPCKHSSENQLAVPAIESSLPMPSQILDLHSHMFNIRYLPMEGMIDDALGTNKSLFARLVAQLLYRMTGSSYEIAQERQDLMRKRKAIDKSEDPDLIEEFYITEIVYLAKYELLVATNSPEILHQGLDPSNKMSQMKEDYPGLMNSDLFEIISHLEKVKFREEWEISIPKTMPPPISLNMAQSVGDILDVAGYLVKRALWIIVKMVMPKLWSEAVDSYAEFLFTLLSSEERIMDRFAQSYGDGLRPIRTVHYMMDMQMAYKDQLPAFYVFPSMQLDRMQTLQRQHAEKLLGFSAFDPRRRNWKKIAIESRKKGFIGFKFYPAMGYRPSCDKKYQKAINKFFDWCASEGIPIFVHCTPQGFETSKKEGQNAHPKYWEPVLQKWNNLRLCFGHAGGGRMGASAGWLANCLEEWETDHNYAYIVAKLCRNYENVYCEMAYITELLGKERSEESLQIFLSNIERAKKIDGKYDFMTKIAYGSDWHMPHMVTHARRYLDVWRKVFSLEMYSKYLEHFFWMNGYAYLHRKGINAGVLGNK